MSTAKKPLNIFTIGHSTRPIDEFIDLLQRQWRQATHRHPHHPKIPPQSAIQCRCAGQILHAARISYLHLKELGGLRHPRQDSVNLGWRNASFRGYADYMQTPEFAAGLDRAIELARQLPPR